MWTLHWPALDSPTLLHFGSQSNANRTRRIMSTQLESPTLACLKPASVWRYFYSLASVPRPSLHEELIRAHVRGLASELGFVHRQDAAGNILIEVPAAPGCEHVPATILQGHLDMVAEKESEVSHSFENDPIKPVIDVDQETGDRIVRAAGTTLGADNGIGVALALAAATDEDVVHGPLELLFTSNEEMGMTGAKSLEPRFFMGRRMINLDSEEDDAIYIGCAGGIDVTLTWTLDLEPVQGNAEVCRVRVSGLRGGHSGDMIHLNHANANKVLALVLREADIELQLAEITGGSKRNAIPREASAVVAGPPGTVETLRAAADRIAASTLRASHDTKCEISVNEATADRAASADATRRLSAGLVAAPSGVLAVVPDIPGLTQTSNNVSTITSDVDDGRLHVVVGCLARSSSEDDKLTPVHRLRAIGELAGAEVETGNEYPGWAPNVDSPLLAVCRRVYEAQFGAAPRVAAIHAGLECGIIGERIGEIDMVSFGPRIDGAHSPAERVWVDSVEKSYGYLKSVLKALTES
jgi:dipeptidase D